MKINKNSWHYKYYRFTYGVVPFTDDTPPKQTNLCQYVQRIVWMTPINLIAALMFAIVVLCVFGAFITTIPFALIFGYKPCKFWTDEHYFKYGTSWHKPYLGLKTKYINLYPYHFLLVLGALVVEYFCWHNLFHLTLIIHLSIIVMLILVGVRFFINNGSETSELVRSWWNAKTKGICPLITFEDNEE